MANRMTANNPTEAKATPDRNGAPMELVPATVLGLALTALAWIYACWALR